MTLQHWGPVKVLLGPVKALQSISGHVKVLLLHVYSISGHVKEVLVKWHTLSRDHSKKAKKKRIDR